MMSEINYLIRAYLFIVNLDAYLFTPEQVHLPMQHPNQHDLGGGEVRPNLDSIAAVTG